jgi:hypothetical protein
VGGQGWVDGRADGQVGKYTMRSRLDTCVTACEA